MDREFLFGWWKYSKIDCSDDCTSLKTPKATELYPLKKWVVWDVNYFNKAVI